MKIYVGDYNVQPDGTPEFLVRHGEHYDRLDRHGVHFLTAFVAGV